MATILYEIDVPRVNILSDIKYVVVLYQTSLLTRLPLISHNKFNYIAFKQKDRFT